MISSALEKLHYEVKAGNRAAIDAFWQKVKETGTPLIEPLSDGTQRQIATFLYKQNDDYDSVIVYGEFPGFDDEENRLVSLPGTDVMYKSFIAPPDIWSLYVFRLENTETQTITYVPDPLSSQSYTCPEDPEKPGCPLLIPVESVVALPNVESSPWEPIAPIEQPGDVTVHRHESPALGNSRRIWIYTPPNYDREAGPYPLILLTDGWEYLYMAQLATRFDQAIAEGNLKPFIAVMVESLDYKQREKELTCYPPFRSFICDELLPWLRTKYNLSDRPEETAIAGASYGGLFAAWLGLTCPDIFGHVFSQSGAFYWQDDWLIGQVAVLQRSDVRFHLEAGQLEPEMLTTASERMYRMLQDKGFKVSHRLTRGGHHYIYWGETLLEMLQFPV